MKFNTFSELREFIRRYNSTSVLEIGAKRCWQIWEAKALSSSDWVSSNAERNYAIRLILLSSKGNPHRQGKIDVQRFDELINVYHNWDKHTISDKEFLKREAILLYNLIEQWEHNNSNTVRNWSLKLSSTLNLKAIRANIYGLFLQRIGAFQNSGFGSPTSRIERTIKLVKLLDDQSENNFSNSFSRSSELSPEIYFKFFLVCLHSFSCSSTKKGFCNLSELLEIDSELWKSGITSENLKLFIRKNSLPFCSQADASFRSRVSSSLSNTSDFYQPFFYNHLLEVPLIELTGEKFCMPDPFSFTESCWNRIASVVSENRQVKKKLGNLLSKAFESYLEKILFSSICADSFQKISEVKCPSSKKDKRADFLIETKTAYIVIECKNSVMSSDTSSCFQAEKVADLWCRIHSACEQISATVEAFQIYDKPVIPLVLVFYDSIAASIVFKEIVKGADYCSLLNLSMPPVVYSIHEFEHLISHRSLNNWSELILSGQDGSSSIPPDNKGHNYEHLRDSLIF